MATPRLSDKVALITGAGLGMGREASLLFSEEGARIVALDVLEDEVQTTARMVEAAGGECLAIQCDVSSEADVRRATQEALAKFGVLDIVYNNAGVLRPGEDGPVTEIERDVWDRLMGINVTGMYLVCKHCVPTMIERRQGSIINTSSISALVGEIETPNDCYCTSKGAVLGLTQSLAAWLAKYGIRVNAVLPGMTATPMQKEGLKNPEWVEANNALIPLGRIATAREIVTAALFLASDESAYVTGADLVVDGGCMVI